MGPQLGHLIVEVTDWQVRRPSSPTMPVAVAWLTRTMVEGEGRCLEEKFGDLRLTRSDPVASCILCSGLKTYENQPSDCQLMLS